MVLWRGEGEGTAADMRPAVTFACDVSKFCLWPALSTGCAADSVHSLDV